GIKPIRQPPVQLASEHVRSRLEKPVVGQGIEKFQRRSFLGKVLRQSACRAECREIERIAGEGDDGYFTGFCVAAMNFAIAEQEDFLILVRDGLTAPCV